MILGLGGAMQIRQHELELLGTSTRMVTWLPVDSRVKVGTVLSLDKNKEKYKVLSISNITDSSEIKRGFRVGGLF